MIGLLFLAVSPFLSTVSAVCCLGTTPGGAPTTDCPTTRNGRSGQETKAHWECCYVPQLSSHNCRNDYGKDYGTYFGPASQNSCHRDSTNEQENGRWICVE
ncbi:hypothetical protein COCCADRAFT_22569 [Bipolaris zeicola 26-R-13]|uniref:Secreted protein n=1 Tax=Cochliobolus carbonum (strain 26-R-13) TaxID=930089 RepID=W6YJP5_COCC2|nr:uncharacterized protein COCCADRAFT_22569 [Bipolaris zeicola 26-R-13]EUC37805.1 hypothetical protein COCCADRAFT_22569 [Bipolaris zeicola 26-R-13]